MHSGSDSNIWHYAESSFCEMLTFTIHNLGHTLSLYFAHYTQPFKSHWSLYVPPV